MLHVFPSFVPAGSELRTVQLIASFGTEFRHSILALDGRTSAADRLPPEAPVTILPRLPSGGSLRGIAQARGILKAVHPELLLTYNWGAFDFVLAATSRGWRRMIHHEDGFNADEAIRFKRRRTMMRRFGLKRVHRLVVPSQRLMRIATRPWKVASDRVELIPNGISIERFLGSDHRVETRRTLGISSTAPVVGTVGGLRPVKNVGRLIDAVSRMESSLGVHLIIVGDGGERGGLEQRVQKLGVAGRVHFVGYQADVTRFLQAMDVFALSSDSEQMPVCLIEAMASGLAIVATKVGDIEEMLPSAQHLYLTPLSEDDPIEGLVRGLRHLICHEADRRKLGKENRERAKERYELQAMCDAYRRTYWSALEA